MRPAKGPRYGRAVRPGELPRASESDDPVYRRVPVGDDGHPALEARRNRVHSILTAAPVLMFIIGLVVFYRNEGAQTDGGPLAAASEQMTGIYQGVSMVKGAGGGRHYLWVGVGESEERRGFRLQRVQAAGVRDRLAMGDTLTVDVAPTVVGSDTRWLWRLVVDGEVLVDESATLR